MAFKGGFLVKPTTTSTDALAALYLNAVKGIADKKREIKKEEFGLLKESVDATNVPHTGVATFDSIMGQYGVSQRKNAQALYDARQRNEISTDQYTMGMINNKSETELFSRYPEFIAKENAAIQKGIESGEISGVNSDMLIGRFADLNGGNPEAENQVYSVYHNENGQGILRLDYTSGGEPKYKDIAINKLMNPNKKKILAFDINEYVKNFKDSRGMVDYLIVEEVEENGIKRIDKSVDPSKSDIVKRSIERNVSRIDEDNELIDVLYQNIGARVDYSSEHKNYTEEQIKDRFGYKTNEFSIDEYGNGIELRPEDFTFNVEDNKIVLTERQKKIGRGIVRASLYDSLDLKKTTEIIEADTDTGFVDAQMRPSAGIFTTSIVDFAKKEIDTVTDILGKTTTEQDKTKADFEILRDKDAASVAMNIRPEHSKRLLAAIQPQSASGAKMNNVNNIVSLKIPVKEAGQEGLVGAKTVGYEYKIMFTGSADIAKTLEQLKSETGNNVSELDLVSRIERIFSTNQAMSPFQDESIAQDAYLVFYESDKEFRRAADEVFNFKDKGDPGIKDEKTGKYPYYGMRYSKAFHRIFEYLKRR